ncbi:hypothetical protein [Methylobacterium terricola]|uniref:hypothetical protein n=1 Tax=Methylobacterium terricola TaxID=2583531 RepID=UPI0014862FAD|nr:hypothetical protein [Methylobacterium terricola]
MLDAMEDSDIFIASDRPPVVGVLAAVEGPDSFGATDAPATLGDLNATEAPDSFLALQTLTRLDVTEDPDTFVASGFVTVKPSFVPGRPVATVPVAEPPLVKRPLAVQRTLPEPPKAYDPLVARAHNEQILAHLDNTLSATQGNDGIPVRDKKTGKLYMLEIHDGEIVKTYVQG